MSGGSKPLRAGGRISPKGVVLAALPTQASRRLAPEIRHKKPTSLSEVGTALRGVSTLLGARVLLPESDVNSNAKKGGSPTPPHHKSGKANPIHKSKKKTHVHPTYEISSDLLSLV